jgi:hypothetical protein
MTAHNETGGFYAALCSACITAHDESFWQSFTHVPGQITALICQWIQQVMLSWRVLPRRMPHQENNVVYALIGQLLNQLDSGFTWCHLSIPGLYGTVP